MKKSKKTQIDFSDPQIKEFIENELKTIFHNGLADAIGYGPGIGGGIIPAGINGIPDSTYYEQVSQTGTLFKNLRWYLVSNFRQVLSEAYVELGLIQTIVDVPVDDGLRGGVDIKSQQLNEQQIEELQIAIDRDDDLNIVGQALKWNRLFGGAGILILTDQDPEMPLDIEAIDENTPLEFRAVDMWELFWDKQNTEGYDPTLQTHDFEFYSYYGEHVHKSRVMPMKGMIAPSFIRPRLRGWGFSVVEILVRSINQYLKATDLAFEVMDEFKIDYYKIKNLVNTLVSPTGSTKVKERIQLANWQKNYQNAVVMDSEDEFDHKQLSFAGLADVMTGIRMQVASDLRMPLTKIFGISAAGFNSGEDDIEVYNAMVESQVRSKSKYIILKVLEIKCQQLFGMIPDDLQIEFKPLRMLSSEQQENVKTQKFTRLIQARQAGEISSKDFKDACNKGDLFDVILDTTDDELDLNMEDVAAAPSEADEFEDEALDPAAVNNPESETPIASNPPDDPQSKVENEKKIFIFPKPYSDLTKVRRIISNSMQFDFRSYLADGGDGWIDERRKYFFDRDKAQNKSLWDRAATEAKAIGKDWRFIVWLYRKLGGKF